MAAAAAVGDGVGEGEGHDLGYPNATKSCPTPVNVAMTTTMTHQQRAVLLLWGVGVSAAAAAEPDRDRCAGGVAAADASRLNSAVVAAAVVGPVVRTWHQSLLRPTSQPSAGDDGAVDIRILRSLDDWVRLDPRTTTEAAAAVGAVHARRTTNPPSLSIPLLLLLLDNCYDDGDAAVVAPFATAVRRTMKPNC